MMQKDLVSVIIPVYNRPDLLPEAVESALRQTYRPVEVIVVDDGSTDNTGLVIDQLCADHPEVSTVYRSNGGVGAARETGRQAASGEFIQYLDSDDLLLADKFSIQVAALRSNEKTGIAYGKTHHSRVGSDLKQVAFKRTGEKFQFLFPDILQSRWWSTSTPLYRRSVTDAIGPWEPLCNEEDWEYEVRAAALGVGLVFCDEFVSVTRWHNDHLHHGGATDPIKLRHRARSQELIFSHIHNAGMISDIPQWDHYVRSLFLLCRQCGVAGLADESKRLHRLACQGMRLVGRRNFLMEVYGWGAAVVGWQQMSGLARVFDNLRNMRQDRR